MYKKPLLAWHFDKVTAFGAMTGKAVYNSPQWWSAHKRASSLTVKCTHHLYKLHVNARTHRHVAVWLHFWLYSATCRIICFTYIMLNFIVVLFYHHKVSLESRESALQQFYCTFMDKVVVIYKTLNGIYMSIIYLRSTHSLKQTVGICNQEQLLVLLGRFFKDCSFFKLVMWVRCLRSGHVCSCSCGCFLHDL